MAVSITKQTLARLCYLRPAATIPNKASGLIKEINNLKNQKINDESIIRVLNYDWQTVRDIIFKLKIRDMMDARYLQIKLKQMERQGKILTKVKMGRKLFCIKKE